MSTLESRAFHALVAGAAIGLAGCGGKPPEARVDAQKERQEAHDRAANRAYGGDAVKALDKAKALGDDVNRKALESVETAEKDAK